MLSIIIPALNEEKYLPRLLESIKKQDFHDYEIIVADADSKDRTAEIAKNEGCAVVRGGLPAKGRNEGARAAKGDVFMFIDADVVLPDAFLKNALSEFEKKNLAVASVTLDPQHIFLRVLYNLFYNFPIVLLATALPHGAGCIIVQRAIFERVGGFDESIALAEDMYFVRRARLAARQAKKLGKFGILRSTKIFADVRRFQKDGFVKTYLKFLLCELHMIFIGPVKSDAFKYRFNHYQTDQSNRTDRTNLSTKP